MSFLLHFLPETDRATSGGSGGWGRGVPPPMGLALSGQPIGLWGKSGRYHCTGRYSLYYMGSYLGPYSGYILACVVKALSHFTLL